MVSSFEKIVSVFGQWLRLEDFTDGKQHSRVGGFSCSCFLHISGCSLVMVKVYMQVPKDAQGLTSSLGRASIFDVCPARLCLRYAISNRCD